VVTKQGWTESAGLGDRRQASDERGRGGVIRVTVDHSGGFGVFFFLELGASGLRTNFFEILHAFSQTSIALGGVVVVLWSLGVVATSVAGVHKSYAMHKSTTVHVMAGLIYSYTKPTAAEPAIHRSNDITHNPKPKQKHLYTRPPRTRG
jgi:hypothetical protein